MSSSEDKTPRKEKKNKAEGEQTKTDPNAPSIRAVRVSKWYGPVTALQDVSLHLDPGVWGLLGPNGSGKTTFLRMCAGQIQPSLGELRVNGRAPFADVETLRRIGLCPEADAMYDDLTGLEFVAFMAEMSGFGRKEAKERAAASIKELGLDHAQDRKIGGYSRGMRQRAKLAQALVHEPDVLLLDEPLTGTDPLSRATILEQVRKRAEAGAVVLFSTHVLHEVEALTDRLLLIARGQVVAQGHVHEIRDMLDEHPHHIRVQCDRPRQLAARLLEVPGVQGVHFPTADSTEVWTRDPEATYRAVTKELLAGDYEVGSITSPDATLEALFHYLVDRGSRMAGTGADAQSGASTAAAKAASGGGR